MNEIHRRAFIHGLGAAVTLAPGISLRAATEGHGNPDLTKVNSKFLVTEKEVHAWHVHKDSKGGPTMAGGPSWHSYLDLLEKELRAAGVVDIFRNPWTYTRWYTSEWPDDSNWGLQVDGKKIKCASYGCNSGKTPDVGVTGDLVVYTQGMPAEALKGKIAIVIKSRPPDSAAQGDYEYLSSPETFPNPNVPHTEEAGMTPFPIMGLGEAQAALIKAGALGAALVLPLSCLRRRESSRRSCRDCSQVGNFSNVQNKHRDESPCGSQKAAARPISRLRTRGSSPQTV